MSLLFFLSAFKAPGPNRGPRVPKSSLHSKKLGLWNFIPKSSIVTCHLSIGLVSRGPYWVLPGRASWVWCSRGEGRPLPEVVIMLIPTSLYYLLLLLLLLLFTNAAALRWLITLMLSSLPDYEKCFSLVHKKNFYTTNSPQPLHL